MNEIDKLRKLLTDAEIPFENYIEEVKTPRFRATEYGEAGKYDRNQIIYGRTGASWKFDAIWQYGSFGAAEGLIETYGQLGVDEDEYPSTMTAQEAFEIIKADWEKTGGKELTPYGTSCGHRA